MKHKIKVKVPVEKRGFLGMMMNLLLSHSCTSIWRARGMSSILRISVCIMKSISAMQGKSIPKS